MTTNARIGRLALFPLLAAIVAAGSADRSDADDYLLHSFERVRLTEGYFAEGACFGDFNRDGRPDLVAGPFWFEGPEFDRRHRFYDGPEFPNDRGYSDNFFSFIGDLDRDGWSDILVVGLPGTPSHWYRNPAGDGSWERHRAFPAVDNEAPMFADLTGDGAGELICTFEGRLGYATPHPDGPEREWLWHPVSEVGPWQRYTHGMGIGDVNGDGLNDFLMAEGWWEQVPPEEGPLWKFHPVRFCNGGAQIHVADLDGDGDADVVTSLNAHAWGLSWYEQRAGDGGESTFVEHSIMDSEGNENPYGVRFSQLHAVECVDLDGDGRRDIVTGKCYWAHNGSDPGARDPAVLYWFRNTATGSGVEFVPHLIDDDSGVGRQLSVADMNGDRELDVMVANKKGTFLFLHRTEEVTPEAWRQAQPQRRSDR